MNRTARAGFFIALWGMCLFFGNEPDIIKLVGFGWCVVGWYMFMKQEII